MDKEKQMMGKIILAMLIMLMLGVVVAPMPCCAGDVTLTYLGGSNTTWTINNGNIVAAGTTWTSSSSPNSWSIKNNGSTWEDITFTVASSSGAWSWSTSAGLNKFVLQAGGNTVWSPIGSSATMFYHGLGPTYTTPNFGLLFTTPTIGSTEGGVQTLTVTITATDLGCAPPGLLSTYCWRASPTVNAGSYDCANVCGATTGAAPYGGLAGSGASFSAATGRSICQTLSGDADIAMISSSSYEPYYVTSYGGSDACAQSNSANFTVTTSFSTIYSIKTAYCACNY